MIKLFCLPSLRMEGILRRIASGWDLESPKESVRLSLLHDLGRV